MAFTKKDKTKINKENLQYIDNYSVIKKVFSKKYTFSFKGSFVTSSLIGDLGSLDEKMFEEGNDAEKMIDLLHDTLALHTYADEDLPNPGDWYDGTEALFELDAGLIKSKDSPYQTYAQKIDTSLKEPDRICLFLRQFRNASPVNLITYGRLPQKITTGYEDIINFAEQRESDPDTRTLLDAIGRGEYENFRDAFLLFGREADGLNKWEKRLRLVEQDKAPLFDAVGNEREFQNWLHSGAGAWDIYHNWDVADEVEGTITKFPNKATYDKYAKSFSKIYAFRKKSLKKQVQHRFD